MSDKPTVNKQYIELGYITVDEKWTSPLVCKFVSEKEIIEMVQRKAAEYGADAVINFHISGKEPGKREAEGTAIKYE